MKFSAGYANTNNNFCIVNLHKKKELELQDKQIIAILSNILQRGVPTIPSKYIQNNLSINNFTPTNDFIPLISKEKPTWTYSIKGGDNGYNPALQFFNSLNKYFPEFPFLQQLILPEAYIKEILPNTSDKFISQQVDFYLPQAKLVIEIDGSHHQSQCIHDEKRNSHFAKNGIKTTRISTADLQNEKNLKIKIDEIKSCLNSANDFKKYKHIDYAQYRSELQLTSICRMQILFLQLLNLGYISLNEIDWKFSIASEQENNLKFAFEDLMLWFENLYSLQNISFTHPKILFVNQDGIKVDFDIFKRYDDNCKTENTIFVRTDYFDDNNYFKISSASSIIYDIKEKQKENTLRFFIENIFDKKDFFSGQLSIIVSALKGENTIGILPTGGGKSLCYQFASLLQPGISFIISPLKSLMVDQKENLDKIFFSNTAYIISGEKTREERERVQYNFSKGKYLFIWISPERLQIKSFREYLISVNANYNINYAVIDEIHCLSEWGHDFRTSYLNLSKTVRDYCPTAKCIGLTATASSRVHKDIIAEFNIKDENIKTLINFDRPELTFKVIKCASREKKENVFGLIKQFQSKYKFLDETGDDSRAALIFTANVDGKYGCYFLSNEINLKYKDKANYFSGRCPTIKKKDKNENKIKVPIMENGEWDKHKLEIQNEFKNNYLPILVATKSFGMGIDKPNINLTIHYGLSASIESTYQEAGRAGRHPDKNNKAKSGCFILFSDEDDNFPFYVLDNKDTTVEEIQTAMNVIEGYNKNDIARQLYFFLNSFKGTTEEYENIKNVWQCNSGNQNTTLKIYYEKNSDTDFSKKEKAIYRLSLLDLVGDYTIEFNQHYFEVEFKNGNDKTIKSAIKKYIGKYDKELNVEEEIQKLIYERYSEKCIRFLLKWIYDNVAYERRQSLKGLRELCVNYDEENSNSPEIFKKKLIAYFEINEVTIILQHIADNPTEYLKWFEVFHRRMRKADNTVTDLGIIDKKGFEDLKEKLKRFLESYRDNTGLNFISGFVRLYLNDYENSDGRIRFESALQQIKKYDEKNQKDILQELLPLKKLTFSQKNLLSESILKNLSSDYAEWIYEMQGDNTSLNCILQKNLKKLTEVNEQIYG